MDFGTWFDAQLREKQWTLRRVAAALHITPAAVRKWIKGSSVPDRAKIPDISKLFGVPEADVRAFYTWEDVIAPPEEWRHLKLYEVMQLPEVVDEDIREYFLFMLRELGPALIKAAEAFQASLGEESVEQRKAKDRNPYVQSLRYHRATRGAVVRRNEPAPPVHLERRNGTT